MKQILLLSFILLSTVTFGQVQYILSGVVTDSTTGKSLEGIDIFVKDVLTGTITSYSGEYQLFLQSGIYKLVVSGAGYKEKEFEIRLKDHTFVKIELDPELKSEKKKPTTKQSLYPMMREQALNASAI